MGSPSVLQDADTHCSRNAAALEQSAAEVRMLTPRTQTTTVEMNATSARAVELSASSLAAYAATAATDDVLRARTPLHLLRAEQLRTREERRQRRRRGKQTGVRGGSTRHRRYSGRGSCSCFEYGDGIPCASEPIGGADTSESAADDDDVLRQRRTGIELTQSTIERSDEGNGSGSCSRSGGRAHGWLRRGGSLSAGARGPEDGERRADSRSGLDKLGDPRLNSTQSRLFSF